MTPEEKAELEAKKNKLIRTSSSTALRAQRILETLKKKSEPPKKP